MKASPSFGGGYLMGAFMAVWGVWMAVWGITDSKRYGTPVHFDPDPKGWFLALVGVTLIAWTWVDSRRDKPKK